MDGQPDFDLDLERGYRSHLAAFGERDRLLIELDMGVDSMTEEQYLARIRIITGRFPGDWSAWWKYADELVHWGPLIGYTNADARAALQRTVDLNPKLVPMWQHLFGASAGFDSSQAALASKSLTALADDWPYRRLLLSASGPLPVPLLDSVVASIVGAPDLLTHLIASVDLHIAGYPAAQIEFNRRLLALDPRGPYADVEWEGIVLSWAARGAWDSALVASDRWAAIEPQSTPLIYQFLAVGALLGGLDTALAGDRRAAALKYLAGLPPDSADAKEGHARLAWADGMLAFHRRDRQALAEARERVRQSGYESTAYLERSLAGFELELRGAKQAAAESLAALDFAATTAGFTNHVPYVRSISHLAASRLLLEQADTSRALRLLFWHEGSLPLSMEKPRSQVFAALAYYELARIEDAQGKSDLALDHYRQFLRRYDMPPPAHQHMVDEANAALRRLAGQNDAPATR